MFSFSQFLRLKFVSFSVVCSVPRLYTFYIRVEKSLWYLKLTFHQYNTKVSTWMIQWAEVLIVVFPAHWMWTDFSKGQTLSLCLFSDCVWALFSLTTKSAASHQVTPLVSDVHRTFLQHAHTKVNVCHFLALIPCLRCLRWVKIQWRLLKYSVHTYWTRAFLIGCSRHRPYDFVMKAAAGLEGGSAANNDPLFLDMHRTHT